MKQPPLPPDRPQPPSYALPAIYYFDFGSVHTEKPWRKPGVDLSDYFNYGFNEELWRVYVEKIKELHEKAKYSKTESSDDILPYKEIPVELGGMGPPINTEFNDFEAINLLLNKSEQFLDIQNLTENNFYIKLSQFLESSLFSENAGYYTGILQQFAEKYGVDVLQKPKKLKEPTAYKPSIAEPVKKKDIVSIEKNQPPSPKRASTITESSYIDLEKLKIRKDTDKFQTVRLKKRPKLENNKNNANDADHLKKLKET